MSFTADPSLAAFAAIAVMIVAIGWAIVWMVRTPPPESAQGGGEEKAAEGNAGQGNATLAEITPNLLPIEKKGSRLHIAASEIFCVRANAHYTYLFNGRDELFCPLSISEIEARLPKRTFFRAHRSYIVNLAHVSGVKKVADAAIAELDSPLRRTAPISRGRVAALRAELDAFRSAIAPPG